MCLSKYQCSQPRLLACTVISSVHSVETMTWLQPRTTGSAPLARNAQTMTAVGSKLYLFGGHSGSKHLRDLYVLDTTTMSWSQPEQAGQIPPGLRGHTANLIGARTLFVFGGYDGRGRSNDLYLLEYVPAPRKVASITDNHASAPSLQYRDDGLGAPPSRRECSIWEAAAHSMLGGKQEATHPGGV